MTSNQGDSSSIPNDQIKTFKEFLSSYNKMSEHCFDACTHDFSERQVQKAEETCALNCLEKYLKMNQRISQRFHEYQMIVNETNIVAAQKLAAK